MTSQNRTRSRDGLSPDEPELTGDRLLAQMLVDSLTTPQLFVTRPERINHWLMTFHEWFSRMMSETPQAEVIVQPSRRQIGVANTPGVRITSFHTDPVAFLSGRMDIVILDPHVLWGVVMNPDQMARWFEMARFQLDRNGVKR